MRNAILVLPGSLSLSGKNRARVKSDHLFTGALANVQSARVAAACPSRGLRRTLAAMVRIAGSRLANAAEVQRSACLASAARAAGGRNCPCNAASSPFPASISRRIR